MSIALGSCRFRYEELPASVAGGGDAGNGGAGLPSAGDAGANVAGEAASSGSGGNSNGGMGQPPNGGTDPGAAGESTTGGSLANGGTSGSPGTAGSGGSPGNAGAGTGGSGGAAGGCAPATYGGHNYLVCTSPKGFVNAVTDCATRGYYPVRIDSAGEQTFVHDSIPIADQNNNSTSVWRWLGATGTTGNWKWSDGEQFWSGGNQGTAVNGAYTNWSQGQPGNPSCLAMQARAGTWSAVDCFATRPYVCEQY